MNFHPVTTFMLLFILSVIFSCEKTVDNIKTPNSTEKLVLHSFICPDDTFIYVNVGTTANLFNGNYPGSDSVKVTLHDHNKIIPFGNLQTDFPKYDYSSCKLKYPIAPGNTYTITATCPGFPDASAEFTVPLVKNLNMVVDTFRGNFSYLRFEFKFTDIPHEENYYNVYLKKTVYSQDEKREEYLAPLDMDDETRREKEISTYLISDHLMDGKTFSVSFADYNFFETDSLKYEAIILETQPNYYKYHQSLINYENSEDPFTEFSPVYSNINGGYGIVTSYVRYLKEFTPRRIGLVRK